MVRIILLLYIFNLSLANSSGQETYLVDTKYPVHDLTESLMIYVDSADHLSPENVLNDSTLPFLRPDELPRFLPIGVPSWAKLTIIAPTTLKGWAFVFEDRMIGPPAWAKSNGKVDVYGYLDSRLIFHKRTGVEYPKVEREDGGHWVLNQVGADAIPLDKPVTLVIRAQGNSIGYPPYFNLSIRTSGWTSYHRIFQPDNFFNIFMFGVTFITFLYHLLQFLYVKERVFFWFSLWLLLCTLTMAMSAGLLIGAFTTYRFPIWLIIANGIFYASWFFGRSFVDSKRKFPFIDKWILGLAFFTLIEQVLLVLYTIIADPLVVATSAGVHYPMLMLYTLGSLIVAIMLVLKKDLFARYFGIGALIGCVALIAGTLYAMGFIRPPVDPFALSLFLQIVIYSFGIAYRQQYISQQTEQERLQAQYTLAEMQRIRDLNAIKTKFFANISHEFRTPLTLISGPLKHAQNESAKTNSHDNIVISSQTLQVIQKNTDRLTTLVDQLLELSRLESGTEKLRLHQGKIMAFIRAMIHSFESLAERQNINLHFNCGADNEEAFYDKDKLEKIITNVLSNAFKYTPDGGAITVVVDLGSSHLSIEITDTGKGIDKAEVKHIFERFYRIEGTEKKGSGIGLALTKELVDLHGGTISVHSAKDKGTTFKIRIPTTKVGLMATIDGDVSATSVFPKEAQAITEGEDKFDLIQPKPETSTLDLPSALIVEDNADLRQFLARTLNSKYHVLQAQDGLQGERMAFEHIPDIIISDIMMPLKDGFQLCNSLKNNAKTSHIPLILLTAKAGQENKIAGLTQGADGYLTKPFDEQELHMRMRNLLEVQRKLFSHWQSLDMFLVQDIEIKTLDDRFVQDTMLLIKANLDNEGFGVEDMVRSLGFSRSQLHRKLRAVLGKSANQLIVEVRLNEAYNMLKNEAGSVSEIAYSVGYTNLSYFTKSFKQKFGVLPSKVRDLKNAPSALNRQDDNKG